MKTRELLELGVPPDCITYAINAIKKAIDRGIYGGKAGVRKILPQVISAPEMYTDEANWYELANAIIKSKEKSLKEAEVHAHNPLGMPNGFPQWGSDFEEQALDQMRTACELPIAVAGALMPDAHLGYGLPVGFAQS